MAAATEMINLQFYLTYNGITSLLQVAPDGWNAEKINWERSTKYFGMFRKFTIPLQFVKFGATLIRSAFYTDGYNAEVALVVKKRNRKTNVFETEYTGKIDFATFKDFKDYVEVSCIEGGLSADLMRFENTQFSVPFPDGYRPLIDWYGQVSNFETFDIASPQQLYDDQVIAIPDPTVVERRIYTAFQDNTFKDINAGTISLEDYGTGGTPWYGGIIIERDCGLTIEWHPGTRVISIYDEATSPGSVQYRYREMMYLVRGGTEIALCKTNNEYFTVTAGNEWQQFYPTTELYDAVTGDPLPNNIYPLTGYYDFQIGDKIVIRPEIRHAAPADYYWRYDNNSAERLTVSIYDRLEFTEIPAWKPKDLFAALADKMGGYAVKSDFLDTCKTMILPTVAIRDRKSISATTETKTSIADLFKSIFVTDEIGMGVEVINGVETLVIESLDYFLSSSVIHDFGNVTNFQLEPASDLIPSQINVGYNLAKSDTYYGRYEFNGMESWRTPAKILKNEFDWISPYRGDILGVDMVRLEAMKLTKNKSDEIASKGTQSDDQIFLVDVNYSYADDDHDHYYIARDYDINNFPWPETAGNIRLTPKRCLLRHQILLGSVFGVMQGDLFEFASGDANNWIETKLTTESTYLVDRYDLYASIFGAATFYT